MEDQPVARTMPIHVKAQTETKLAQTSMPGVGFESATPEFERPKIVNALDLVATVTGSLLHVCCVLPIELSSW
jgi:hypothetical protein